MLHKNGLTNVILRALSFAVLSLVAASAFGQDAPSVADLARQARAAKNKGTQTSPESASTAATSTTDPPVNSQPASGEISNKRSNEKHALSKLGGRLDGMDLHYLDDYEEAIRTLFEQEKFESIDQLADAARATRARLPGGYWTLHTIYIPLMLPAKGTDDASEAEWISQLERLKRWMAQRPKSVTAHVALAGAYLQYGWRARGSGFANSVTEDGWQLFHKRVDIAAETLRDAAALPTKCPEWYLTMQLVARAQDRDSDEQAAIFEKAIFFEPEYHYFYRTQAESLLPKWGGEEGQMASFAGRIADRIGGKKGDLIYYQIATFLNCACDADHRLNGMSWPRIQRGYAALDELYGQSILNLNAMSYMASMSGDQVYAQKLFLLIGENWYPFIWHTRQAFDEARRFANFSVAIIKETKNALKAADENLQTPEGRAFHALVRDMFTAKYKSVVTDCQNSFGDELSTPFDLLIQLGKSGAVEQIYSSVTSGTSNCIGLKIQSGIFPAPPKPSYWVKIGL
jgi:hypothetical protein